MRKILKNISINLTRDFFHKNNILRDTQSPLCQVMNNYISLTRNINKRNILKARLQIQNIL